MVTTSPDWSTVDLTAKIQQYITIDTSGQDQDTIEISGENGEPVAILMATSGLYRQFDNGEVVLPDGTSVTSEDVQYAFQEKLIALTGMCVLEHDYVRSGHTELAKLARSARGAEPL